VEEKRVSVKYEFYLTIGFSDNADQREEIEFDNELSDEELDAEVTEWANNFIEYGARKC
jgi:hypothetical protein